MINKHVVVGVFGLLLLLFYALFLKGFFPIKQGLKGFSVKDDAPLTPGRDDKFVPYGKYDRFILLVIDAFREDFAFSYQYQMPFLRKLIANGHGLGFVAKAHPPTVTLPRIKALTTGNIPGFVDVILNFGSPSLEDDNIVTQLYRADKHLVFYGDDTWMKLFPDHFLRTDGTTSFFVTDYTEVDTNVTRHLPDELTRYDWDAMILHYLGLDHIGHLAGPRSPLVPPKLVEMDGVIHKIYQAMKHWDGETGLQSVMVVCGDHGMSDQGGHGGASQGETIVPVIFISPNFQDNKESSHTESENILQIDVAPTLSALLGIPIPKNNLGKIVTQALIGYSLEEKVRLMQLNGHQVAGLLRNNVANIEKERGYWLFEQTVERHSDWLKKTNISQESWETIGQHLLKDYGKAVEKMRSRVSETSTNYDLHLMGVSIALLWLVLFFLLCTAVSETAVFHISANRLTVSLICCIPVVLGHMTICTSQVRSDFLCTNNILVILLQLLVTVVVVTATLFSVMILVRWKKQTQQSVFQACIERMLVGGCMLHTLSLMSSSFVEEEHQTWYFYITSLHIFLICHLIGRVCSVSQPIADDQVKYRPRGDNTQENIDYVGLYKQRISQDKAASERLNSGYSENVSLSSSVKAISAMFVVLAVCRVLRRWNQTGDKWLTVPDIGDWLVRPENKVFLSTTMVISMMCLTVTRWCFATIYQSLLGIVAMTTTYCYQAANGAVFFPGMYSGTSKGLLEARTTYMFLLIYLVLSLWQWWNHRENPNYESSGVWSSLQSAWLMLMMLILRPHNIILVAMAALIENLVSNRIIRTAGLRPAFLTLYCVWMGQAFFFVQGNSNSLTTVDVSAGYVGLDDYRPVLIGLLMFLSTYAGPIFWMISLFKYLHMAQADQGTNTNTLLNLTRCHVTSAQTLLICRCLPLAVYTMLVTVQRYHLFVWTVFSPKLLYEGCLSCIMCVFAFLHVFCAVHYGRLTRQRKKYDQ